MLPILQPHDSTRPHSSLDIFTWRTMGHPIVPTVSCSGGENLPSSFKKITIQKLVKSNMNQAEDVSFTDILWNHGKVLINNPSCKKYFFTFFSQEASIRIWECLLYAFQPKFANPIVLQRLFVHCLILQIYFFFPDLFLWKKAQFCTIFRK